MFNCGIVTATGTYAFYISFPDQLYICLRDVLSILLVNKAGAVGSLQRQITNILEIHANHAILRVISAPNLSSLSTRTPRD